MYQYCSGNSHSMQFDNVKVLACNKNVRKRRLLESFYSDCNKDAINRYVHFSEIYKPIVNNSMSTINRGR